MISALLALAFSAEPALLRLGADVRAILHIGGEAKPAITVSAGRVESLRRAGGGWEADYVPPDEALPQVAILIAVSGAEVASLAIPLWGEGDAQVKTRPHGRISVEIGQQTFGPVVADAQGNAVVPVVVPPGVNEAHQGKRIIPLHVPPSRTLHLALGEGVPAADRAQTLTIYVAASTPQGEPRRGAAIRLGATRGNLSALREREPGLYEAWLVLAPGRPGEVRVSAALDDAPEFVAEESLPLPAGPARRVEIAGDRQRIGADDPRALLHVSARDAAGNPPGDAVDFAATAGELRARATAPGEWDLALDLPHAFGGRDSVEVRASATDASAAWTMTLVPGQPEAVGFERESASVVADGRSRLQLEVLLRDRYGNPIRGVRPELSAGLGTADLEERGGALYASYRPPELQKGGETELELRAGQLEGRAHVTLLPNLRTGALSAKAGVLSNFSGFTAPLLGLEGALRSERLGPELALSLGADYAHREQSGLLPAGASAISADSRLDLLLLHLSVSWRRSFGAGNTFWAGAGPCAAAYWTKVSAVNFPSRNGFAFAPGLQAGLGAERRLRWGVPFLEARAAWVTSPDLPMLTGPLRTLSLLAGVRLETR